MSRSWPTRGLPLALSAAAMLAGCMTVGPDYHRPTVTADRGYVAPNDDQSNIGPVETAVVNLLNRVLLVLILVEIMHTVVLSLRAHHLVTQPLLAVGLVAVIRKILFVLSSEEPVSTAELALLIAMIAVFVAALIVVSRYDPADSAPTDLAATVLISAGRRQITSDGNRRTEKRESEVVRAFRAGDQRGTTIGGDLVVGILRHSRQ